MDEPTGPHVDKRRYERLSLFMMPLAEFRYGYERLGQERRESGGPSRRFYSHSLTHYLAAFYLADGGTQFFAFLHEYGMGGLADRLDTLLSRKVGPHTFRERLADFRDKLLAHPNYTGKRLRELKAKHDVENNREAYGAALDELLGLTHEIALGADRFRKEHGLETDQ